MVYSKKDLKNILENVSTIALIGASSNQDRDSFKVMKYLIEKGYKVFPVNPNEIKNKILNIECFPNLSSIPKKIDMVDIFRSKEFVMEITQDAIKADVKVIWTQEGVIDKNSQDLAKNAGIIFVMDECPKKILSN